MDFLCVRANESDFTFILLATNTRGRKFARFDTSVTDELIM